MRSRNRAEDGAVRILRLETPDGASTDDAFSNRWIVQGNPVSIRWSRSKLTLAALGLATLISFAEATQVYLGVGAQGREIPWLRAMATTFPSWFVLALLLPPTFWLCRRFRLDSPSRGKAVVVHLLASVAFTAVHMGLASWFSDYVFTSTPLNIGFFLNLARLLTIYFMIDTLFYWAIVGGYYAVDYGHRLREREKTASELALKTSKLETSLSRANLEALRMQLNPHFLFNTLNTISVLAMKGEKQRVVRMINRLSDLLRLSLENHRQTISLAEEIDFLQRYLEIEQVRFRDRLTVHVDVPEDLLDAEVPSLVLQPLVENAVIHGVGQQLDGAQIEILARRDVDELILTIRDTGPGFREEQIRNGNGVGLGNTTARLEQLYGSNHRLERSNGPDGGAVVTITIPYGDLPREYQEEVEWRKSAP
jgi:two-component system LytT family sensor kinase